jgi:integrase/recombinase XerD
MNDPCRVQVTGPLSLYAEGFREALEVQGYTAGTVAVQLQTAAQLSRWLAVEGLDVGQLTVGVVDRFFAVRRERVQVMYVSPKALRVLFEHLDGLGVLPKRDVVALTASELLVERFGQFLLIERALTIGTTRNYQQVAARFLSACSSAGVEVADIDAVVIAAFVTGQCSGKTKGWAKQLTKCLRSFLRFLFVENLTGMSAANLVPSAAGWSLASLPKALTSEALAAMLSGCDRDTAAGRRDYAVLVLGARLGLRAGEISGLDLEDIGWMVGELRVRGKGRRVDVLPVPADVGDALADYVRYGRRLERGALFRRIGAPHGRLHPSTVTGIVYRACDRAGIARAGTHRLRHTAATLMLRGGGSLPEIAQVLRHQSPNTTAIYAKVDDRMLSELARPWPGGVS